MRTGYSAIADEWVAIRPGTDRLFVLSLVHELLKAGRVDLDFLVRYTNAGWLVIDDAGAADHGLFARDDAGTGILDATAARLSTPWRRTSRPVLTAPSSCQRAARGAGVPADDRALSGRLRAEAVARETGLSAAQINVAAELAEAAFDREVVIDQPWTIGPVAGREKMIAPVAMPPCATSPPIPTASRPAGRSTCCKCCWAASTTLAVFPGRRFRGHCPPPVNGQ